MNTFILVYNYSINSYLKKIKVYLLNEGVRLYKITK